VRLAVVKIILACLFLIPSAVNASDIYKWTDADGQIHYGQEHPPGVSAQQVRIVHDAPTAEEQRAAQAQLNKLVHDEELAPEQMARADAEHANEESSEAAAATDSQSACTNARRLLLKLDNWAKRAVVEDAHGTQTRLDSTQRQALIGRTNEQIRENCGA